MANNIKGITIEIGGNTEPLQKALKGVNDTSVALQNELKQIDRGLKFDPSNVDLLAQKQTVLSQAVENTAQKLETLKDIDAQLQTKVKSGEVSAEQYRAFQRELVATEQVLDKNSASLEQLGSSADGTGGKIGGLSGIVNGFSDMLGIKLPPQITSMIGKFDEAGASSGGLGEKVSGLAKNLGIELPPSVNSAISGLGGLSAGALAAGAAILVVVKALADMAVQGAKAADDIATNATIMGVTNQTYQEFVAISDLVDTSAETIGSSMSKLTRSMNEARNGSEKTEKAFKRLGVSYKDDLTGALRDSERVFYDVIDALGKMRNQTERDALAMDILGKSARDLNPLIEAGSDKMREFSEYARSHGIIMSDEVTDAYLELADALDWFKKIGEGLKNTLGSIITPGLTSGLETVNDLVGDISSRFQNSQMGEKLKSIFNILGSTISALGNVLRPVLVAVFTFLDKIYALLNMIIAPVEWLITQSSAFTDAMLGNADRAEKKSREANERIASSYRKSADSLLGTNFELQESAKKTGQVIGDSIAEGYQRGSEAAEKELMTMEEANAAIAKSREEARLAAKRYYVTVEDGNGILTKVQKKDYELYEQYNAYINRHYDQLTDEQKAYYAGLSEAQKVSLAKQYEAQIKAQGNLESTLATGAARTEKEALNSGKGIGLKTTDGISAGLEAGIPKVELSTRKVVKAINDEFTKGLEIRSPSRKGYRWGENTLEGYIQGFDSKTDSLKRIIGKTLSNVNALSQSPSQLSTPRGSRILSYQQSMAAATNNGAGSRGGDTYYVTMPLTDIEEIPEAIRIMKTTPQRRRSGQRRER